jgi:hypothetical protein
VTAQLLTASSTTGWADWIHGQLWLLPDGILRIRGDFSTTLAHGHGPTVETPSLQSLNMTRADAEKAAQRHRRSLWVPKELIAEAELRTGRMTDSLRLRLHDGTRIKLLWMQNDGAFEPLQQALGGWLGHRLVVDGQLSTTVPAGVPSEPPRSPLRRRVWLVVGAQAGSALLVLALVFGWFDPLLGSVGDTRQGSCDQARALLSGHAHAPEAVGLHPAATVQEVVPDIDGPLAAFLLDRVHHGTFVHTHENVQDIDLHAEMQHNPGARALAEDHGFLRQVSRQWTDEGGNVVSHVVTQLGSEANAESFLVHVAQYSCRFSEEVWAVDLGDSALPALGQRIPYESGVVAEQVTWVRNGRRHVLAIFWRSQQPDRELLGELFARALPLDDGSPIVP